MALGYPSDTFRIIVSLTTGALFRREREGYIAQLQGDAMALVEALKAVNGGGQAALACLHNAPGVAHGSRQLEETAVGFAYGGMCYDEEVRKLGAHAVVPWSRPPLIHFGHPAISETHVGTVRCCCCCCW